MYRSPLSGDPALSWYNPGYHLLYHPDSVNYCPGCGRQHWLVGRSTAECAFCETALPLNRGDLRTGQTPGELH